MTNPKRIRHATNRIHSSEENLPIAEVIRIRTREIQEEAARISQDEEMSRIRKKEAEKKARKKHGLDTPAPLKPRRTGGQNLNASSRVKIKIKGNTTNNPPPAAEQPSQPPPTAEQPSQPPTAAEQPSHEESNTQTPTNQPTQEAAESESDNEEEGGGMGDGGNGDGEKGDGGNNRGDEEETDESDCEEENDEEDINDEENEEEAVQEQEGSTKGKEIVVVAQEQEVDPKESPKKQRKEAPKKNKGDHIPFTKKMVDLGPEDPPLGVPEDGRRLLWGYATCWACDVYNTIDHKHAVRLMKPGTSMNLMNKWPLTSDISTIGEVPEVVDLVNSTGLVSVANNLGHLGYDRSLCSSMSERFYGETDTFHLPFGEMTITPNDGKFLTGLSIEGKAMKHDNYAKVLEWKKIYEWTKKVFQWDEEKTRTEMLVGEKKQRIFHLSRLRDEFKGTKELRQEGKEVTPERIFATANAYVLYILGVAIFPDVSSARVNANLIQLLDPFDKIHEYSWGTAIIAHSLTQLRKASRSERNQLRGNMAFLQAWIYAHFPSMAKRAFENKDWDGENYGTKYTFKSRPKKQKEDYLDLRVELDNLTAKDVVFDPYKETSGKGKGKEKETDYNEQSEYHGPLFHPGGYVMYNPSRVARQCGFKQKIPVAHKMFQINENKCKSHNLDIVIGYSDNRRHVPTSDYWNNRKFHKYPLTGPSRTDDEAIPTYMPWYLRVSHPRVKRVDERPMIEDNDKAVAILRRRIEYMITRAKLEIRQNKNVKANEMLLAELNALEDVEAGAMFGEQDDDGSEEEEEEEEEQQQPTKKRKKAPPKKMSEGASSSAQTPAKRGRK